MYKPLFLLASAAILASCNHARENDARVEASSPRVVPVAKAAREDLSREVKLAAEFRPFQEIEVHAKVAGYLKKIYVDVGDRVKEGQTLALLEIPEMQDELTRDAAAINRNKADMQRAKEEVDRAMASHQAAHNIYLRLSDVQKKRPNLIAQQEIDDALARDRVAEAGISAARSGLTAAEQQMQVSQADEQKTKTLYGYAKITAPFAGVISKRYADTGAMIPAGTSSSTSTALVRLSQNSRLRLVLPVPESVVPKVHLGGTVEIRVPTLGRSFEGKVSRFGERINSSTRTMETEVDVANPSMLLVPGMYAEAVLTLEKHAGALAVPVPAVVTQGERSSVYVVGAQGVVQDRPVQLGIETPEKVEIVSGLSPGDLVILGGRSQLKPGDKVEPKIVSMANAKEDR